MQRLLSLLPYLATGHIYPVSCEDSSSRYCAVVLLCRIEGRIFNSRDAVYPSRRGLASGEFLLVGSMGIIL
ncbi:MAG: hypothetical protein JNL32_01385 [Candidatus Kapabacteria bacterium]|nr:hypothetical protein [Candidatus Kapabacteria bacterium]